MREFEGKIALVTGASSGIGLSAAIRLASGGARVAMVGRREEKLRQLTAAMEAELVVEAVPIIADVTQTADAKRIVADTIAAFGGIDILVNGAGILVAGTLESTTLTAWDETLNVNLRAAFHLTALAAPSLIERRGNIVNVSSVTGLRAFPGILAYAVSKAGLDQLTRCTALELASRGVRVNAVNPGVVETEAHVAGGMEPDDYLAFIERSRGTHPLGRVGQPEEVAELIAFLASDRAGWITGVTYSIDGGRGITCAR